MCVRVCVFVCVCADAHGVNEGRVRDTAGQPHPPSTDLLEVLREAAGLEAATEGELRGLTHPSFHRPPQHRGKRVHVGCCRE